MRIASAGHGVFAAVLIAIGILGLIKSDWAAIWDGVPKDFPAQSLLPYLCAIVLLASGTGLLWSRSAAPAARLLFAYLFFWMLLFKLRFILLHPFTEGAYQTTGENAVMVAGAWVLYAWFATDWDRRQLGWATGEQGLRWARVLYGLAMIAFGFSHFAYLELTAPLVPSWLPGHVFWAYFTGSAYLAAGAAILSGVYARLAAALSTLQMGLFGLLIWLPMGLAGTLNEFQHGEFVVSFALTAAAWVVTDSYHGVGWFAVGKH